MKHPPPPLPPIAPVLYMKPAHSQSMDALTLTPAWGGTPDSMPDGIDKRSVSESAGEVGSGGSRMSIGGGGGGGGGKDSISATGAPVAYWHKPRKSRTMSSQLVFPTQPTKDTLEILQPDPNLCGECTLCSYGGWANAGRIRTHDGH